MRKIMSTEDRKTYVVRERISETPSVSTLRLESTDNNLPAYVSGQFITVYVSETGESEGRAYSISSSPEEEALHITVKAVGKCSNRLCSMNFGDTLTASLPYGYFYSESDKSPLVMLASGIGITPFRSIIRSAAKNTPSRKLVLCYTNETVEDIVFRKEFDELQKRNDSIDINYFITREEDTPQYMIKGRMNADIILKKIENLDSPEFFICGSISFVRDLWRGLRNAGIQEESMYTEAFF
ncbi:hypothetical protein A3A21_02150 [Candidatus Jorgensenbacteria bacterium RIFCSPLOWO2_01_FULL_45_25b]|uniref:FAD-binding FR-type domain-containing protein n=1 Tax=Candidatus Jorgensenbacteria bacterium RIFCSPLOWO2_01_FULL_45_25b TaxID=1798471 RepID=A0A1F6BZB1_9BACT|nr:MAG: hypothetical protein A3A21_02150 [Candidatus Jorgensenbacteria bacterium RIFCSPLOWO2_01_FULL_45_25b]